MRKRIQFLLLALLVFAGLATAYGATKVTTSFRLANLPPFEVTAACGTSTSVAISGDDGKPSRTKKSMVLKIIAGSNEVDVLLRVHESHGRIWLDIVADDSITHLSQQGRVFDLSTIAPGHPSPTKDAIDSAAIVAAGGS